MQDKIIREYVRLLVETGEDEFGYLYGSYDDLYRMFIKPFVDVAEVAAGEVGKTAARLETLVKVTFEAIISSLIPILSADYKEIFDREKEKIEQIENDHREAYDSLREFTSNPDMVALAFFMEPTSFITRNVAKRSIKGVLRLIDILGKGRDVVQNYTSQFRDRYDLSTLHVAMGEADKHGALSKLDKAVDALTKPKLLKVVASSPEATAMRSKAQSVLFSTLNNVYAEARDVLNAHDLSQLQQHMHGKQIKGIDKLAKLRGHMREKAERELLDKVRASMKKFYVDFLNKRIEQALSAGVPSSSKYVVAHKKTIEKINAF